jgi:hypothetical protein
MHPMLIGLTLFGFTNGTKMADAIYGASLIGAFPAKIVFATLVKFAKKLDVIAY